MTLRITADVGGTFTDVAVTDGDGRLHVGKAPTNPDDAFAGSRAALHNVADIMGTDLSGLLKSTDLFVYSTTRATNALLEKKTAKTALLVTAGFPDVLRVREAGKVNPFDFRVPNPEPYVPADLTFEIPERLDAEGGVVTPLDVEAARRILQSLAERRVEAIAVCLLHSFTNPGHEERLGEMIEEILPGVPYTLSGSLIPVAREYRRASATCIDASLKPLMASHLQTVESELAALGFTGRLYGATIFGGVSTIDSLVQQPIFSAGSGPALAPVAGRHYGASEADATEIIVCDMGGTSFDVSLIRGGRISYAKETWLGGRFEGHLVATPSADVKSIGAGGGSIAWIDPGGLLRVGPESAGAYPGPACYGNGGQRPTITDAALVLGYLDPEQFLGGRMNLDRETSIRVVNDLAVTMGMGVEDAAAAILRVADQQMVGAIRQLAVSEGIDPRECLIVAGGGAAGLSISRVVAELGCRQLLVPGKAGALSAVGGQHSNVVAEFKESFAVRSDDFDSVAVNDVLGRLHEQARQFASKLPDGSDGGYETECVVTGRYPSQVWDIDFAWNGTDVAPNDGGRLAASFHDAHELAYAVADREREVQFLSWTVRLSAALPKPNDGALAQVDHVERRSGAPSRTKQAYFTGIGWVDVPVYGSNEMPAGETLTGPMIVLEPTSTLVVYPGDRISITDSGNYRLEIQS